METEQLGWFTIGGIYTALSLLTSKFEELNLKSEVNSETTIRIIAKFRSEVKQVWFLSTKDKFDKTIKEIWNISDDIETSYPIWEEEAKEKEFKDIRETNDNLTLYLRHQGNGLN